LVSPELLRLKLKELILLLLHTRSADTVLDLFAHLFSPRKASLVEVVKAHLYQDLPLNRLATLAGMSLSTFKREFQQQFQEPPGQYFRTQRLEKAKQLLQTPALSISEVAYQVGFKDVAHFSRAFRQYCQLTPTQFRQMLADFGP
jgi:AraC-like DNA-binding protein